MELSKIEKKVLRAVCGKGIYVWSVFPRVCSGFSELLGDNEVPLRGTKVDPMLLCMDFPRCCFNFDVLNWAVSNDLRVEAGYMMSRPDILVGAMNVLVGREPPRCIKQFDEIERAGNEVMYRLLGV